HVRTGQMVCSHKSVVEESVAPSLLSTAQLCVCPPRLPGFPFQAGRHWFERSTACVSLRSSRVVIWVAAASQFCEATGGCGLPRTEVVFFRENDGSVPLVEWLAAMPAVAR